MVIRLAQMVSLVLAVTLVAGVLVAAVATLVALAVQAPTGRLALVRVAQAIFLVILARLRLAQRDRLAHALIRMAKSASLARPIIFAQYTILARSSLSRR